MSDERAAVLCDLFEQVTGAPIEEHQLRSLALLSLMTQGDGFRHWRIQERQWIDLRGRLESDAVLTFERMLAEARDLDARWTAAKSIRSTQQRLAWMRSERFNVGESW